MVTGAHTGRILVVDDEVNARSALAELLRDQGYDVETAADAFKALGKYREFDPHVVITDLHMPGMDGLELLAKVREEENRAEVLLITAFGEVATAVRAMQEGAATYLTKPVNFDEHDEQLVKIDRLGQVGGSTFLHRADGRRDLTERRDQEHLGAVLFLADFRQQLQAVHSRHVQVRDHDMWVELPVLAERLERIGRRLDVVT